MSLSISVPVPAATGVGTMFIIRLVVFRTIVLTILTIGIVVQTASQLQERGRLVQGGLGGKLFQRRFRSVSETTRWSDRCIADNGH